MQIFKMVAVQAAIFGSAVAVYRLISVTTPLKQPYFIFVFAVVGAGIMLYRSRSKSPR